MLSQWFIWYCFVYMLMRLKKAFHYEPAAKANKDRTIHGSSQFDLHSFPSCTHSSKLLFRRLPKWCNWKKLHYYNLHLIFQILTYGCVFMSLHASGSEWERWGKNRRLRHEWIGKFVAPIANFFKFVTNEEKKIYTRGNRKVNKKSKKCERKKWIMRRKSHQRYGGWPSIGVTYCLHLNVCNTLQSEHTQVVLIEWIIS